YVVIERNGRVADSLGLFQGRSGMRFSASTTLDANRENMPTFEIPRTSTSIPNTLTSPTFAVSKILVVPGSGTKSSRGIAGYSRTARLHLVAMEKAKAS